MTVVVVDIYIVRVVEIVCVWCGVRVCLGVGFVIAVVLLCRCVIRISRGVVVRAIVRAVIMVTVLVIHIGECIGIGVVRVINRVMLLYMLW